MLSVKVDSVTVGVISVINAAHITRFISILTSPSSGPLTAWVQISAANRSIGSTTGFTITEKAFSWLKAPTSTFTFETL